MSKSRILKSEGSIGSLLVSAFFIFVGIMTLYDTTGYSDVDSKVFPQTVAIILIICASGSIIYQFMRPSTEGGFGQGVWWRRVMLIVTMLVACLAMPYLGFLLAGSIAFAGGLISAMHDRWSVGSALLFGCCGLLIMTAFYALFRYALLVPLP